jgi:2-methylisocitrate lyase-like PEP mutase family enzyme
VVAADRRIVVTGRTDNYLQGQPDLDDTIRRLTAFAEVGADVVYAPFPPDLESLTKIVAGVAPTPVNVLISPADRVLTVAELRKAGVKRISLGPALYTYAMKSLEQAAASFKNGDIASVATGIDLGRIIERLARIP